MAVLVAGLVAAVGSSTGAQSDPVVVERVSVGVDGLPQDLPDTVVVAMSDDGGVVAYERAVDVAGASPTPATAPQVWIRDRLGDTGRGVAEAPSAGPGISGNGCIVAYSVLGGTTTRPTSTLTVIDRCATAAGLPLPVGTTVDTVGYSGGTVAVSPPAVSFDGSTLAWSTGREIRRYERSEPVVAATAPKYERTHSFDSTAIPTSGVVTGVAVDLSADGETLVFVAGPGSTPYTPSPSNVYSWDLSTADDGPAVLSSTEAATPSEGASTSPSISGDGAFVVFESSATDLAATGGASVPVPFVVGVDLDAGTAQVVLTDAARPALSADGDHIAYVRGDAIRVLVSTGGDTVDLAPAELAAVRPDGRLAISQFGRWVMFASDADLGLPATAGLSVWAADLASSDPSPVDTTTTTTTPTTATTAPPQNTVPSTTASVPSTVPPPTTAATTPATTLPPSVVVPRFPNTGSSYPSVVRPGSSTSGSSSRAPTSGPSASVPLVVFEPTVVAVGRRTLPVAVSNTSSGSVAIVGVALEPVGPFTVASDACTGVTLVAGGSCTVEVQFAPVEVGRATALMSISLAGGPIVTTTVEGEGVPNPTMDLLPAAAGAGQTVTVFGAGFPPGATVEFVQPGAAVPEQLMVDPDGTFAHVVVVFPNTPTGPLTLSVTGQPDLFDDVTAELLVTSRGTSSDGVALRTTLAGSVAR